MRGKIAAALAFGCAIAAPAMAESCYSNDDVAAARTYWQNANDAEQHWVILHDMGLWNIAGATCNLVKQGRKVRDDEFDIAWQKLNPPPALAEKIEDAARGRPNFFRFLAALYFGVVIPSPEAKAAHD